MTSKIPILTSAPPAPADRPRTNAGPTQDLFFMRFLLHPLPNPSRTRHFRALRAVTAVRAHFPSAFIRVHPRFHHLLRTLRGPSWQITKRTQFSFRVLRVLRVLCGYIHHFVQIRAGSWTEPDQHQIYETNPTRTDPAGRRR